MPDTLSLSEEDQIEVYGELDSPSCSSSVCGEDLMDCDWDFGQEQDVEMTDVTTNCFEPVMVCSHQPSLFTTCVRINSQMSWPPKGTSATI